VIQNTIDLLCSLFGESPRRLRKVFIVSPLSVIRVGCQLPDFTKSAFSTSHTRKGMAHLLERDPKVTAGAPTRSTDRATQDLPTPQGSALPPWFFPYVGRQPTSGCLPLRGASSPMRAASEHAEGAFGGCFLPPDRGRLVTLQGVSAYRIPKHFHKSGWSRWAWRVSASLSRPREDSWEGC